MKADPSGKRWTWRGSLRRDDQRMDLAEPLVLLPGLVVLGVGRAAAWIERLRLGRRLPAASGASG